MRILAISLFVFISVNSTRAVVALAPHFGTNDLAGYITATETVAARRDISFVNGRVDRLENEMNRLEAGFAGLAVLFASVVGAVCLLTARDRLRRKYPVKDTPAQTPPGPAAKI